MAVPCTNNSLGSILGSISHVHGADGKSVKADFVSRLTIDEDGKVAMESIVGMSHESCAIAVDGGVSDSSEVEKETRSLAASGKQIQNVCLLRLNSYGEWVPCPSPKVDCKVH